MGNMLANLKLRPIKAGWLLFLAGCAVQVFVVAMIAQEPLPVAAEVSGRQEATKTGDADDGRSLGRSPALTGARRPLYRLQKSDVIEISSIFAPEFNQIVSVQPDGFATFKVVGDLHVEGLSVAQLRSMVGAAYVNILHEPEITISLKEFDKPYFIVSGEVVHPGKYELRSDITASEALAIAGGFNGQAKHSRVVLFRREAGDVFESRLLDVKAMLKSRNLNQDVHVNPGDLLYVPQNSISKIRKYLPGSSMGMYLNPSQF